MRESGGSETDMTPSDKVNGKKKKERGKGEACHVRGESKRGKTEKRIETNRSRPHLTVSDMPSLLRPKRPRTRE